VTRNSSVGLVKCTDDVCSSMYLVTRCFKLAWFPLLVVFADSARRRPDNGNIENDDSWDDDDDAGDDVGATCTPSCAGRRQNARVDEVSLDRGVRCDSDDGRNAASSLRSRNVLDADAAASDRTTVDGTTRRADYHLNEDPSVVTQSGSGSHGNGCRFGTRCEVGAGSGGVWNGEIRRDGDDPVRGSATAGTSNRSSASGSGRYSGSSNGRLSLTQNGSEDRRHCVANDATDDGFGQDADLVGEMVKDSVCNNGCDSTAGESDKYAGSDSGRHDFGVTAHSGKNGNQQKVYVRQQRMKWLQAKTGESGSQLDPTETAKKAPSGCRDGAVRCRDAALAVPGVGGRSASAMEQRRASETAGACGRRTTKTKIAEDRVREETEPENDREDGDRDRRQAGSSRNSHIGSGADGTNRDGNDTGRSGDCGIDNRIKITAFGSRHDAANTESTGVVVHESSGIEKQGARCETTPDSRFTEQQTRETMSQFHQQKMSDGQSRASLKLELGERRPFSETRPGTGAVGVQEVAVIAASVQSHLLSCGAQASDENVTESVDVVTKTADSVAPKTGDAESARSHDDVIHSKAAGDVLNSFCATSFHEDAFDVFVKDGALDFWSQGRAESQLLRPDLQHDSPDLILEPPESFADETPLKMPVISTSENFSDKPEETRSAEETRTDRPGPCTFVHAPSMYLKTPARRALSWTCVYSRDDAGVGDVSTRCSSTFRDINHQSDNVHSKLTDDANKAPDADGDSVDAADFELPAWMEADFIDQMRRETCSVAVPTLTDELSSEIGLKIIVTHVVDARHFWCQFVNEGVEVT